MVKEQNDTAVLNDPLSAGALNLAQTDASNARRLVAQYGDRLRYVTAWGWLVWDGKRWQQDEMGRVIEYAKELAQRLYWEAADEADPMRRQELWQHAKRSESRGRLLAMVDLAKSDPVVVRTHADFDTDVFLLNVTNGTLDLRTGELRPHSPDDHITKLAPVDYAPGARSEDWERFLSDVFNGDAELIAFMQRGIGYSLTGSVREPAFFIPYGAGRNGKSTLFRAVARVAGDYAADTPVHTFLRKSYTGGATNDQAALAGARLVTASEPDMGQTLDIGLVKRITGGDSITARKLMKEFFTFTPQCKVWMATNNKPAIPENTPAIWARIKLIPFTVSFLGREDPSTDTRLGTEQAQRAILAWAIQGAQNWLANGLQEPDTVKAATQEYRQDEDEMAGFFAEHCAIGPAYSVQSSQLYVAYEKWAEQNKVKSVSATRFPALIQSSLPDKGIRKEKATSGALKNRMLFLGIGLLSEQAPQEEQAASQEENGWPPAAIAASDEDGGYSAALDEDDPNIPF